MKKIINRKQLSRIVENVVRQALLNESNYDDYDYFLGDGTGGHTVNPYPYGTELGDAENWEEMEKQNQMENDWDDFENGRLNNDNEMALAESKIRRMVIDVLNGR